MTSPTLKVFFSWQSDTAARIGRDFLERSLERAIGLLKGALEVEEAIRPEDLPQLEVDQDTKGVPGSPPIVDTIFKKIDKAAVFVADVTFVGERCDKRPTPNPNVLIEYGWALKSLTHERVITVMNTAFGPPTAENLPFDMRHLLHPIQYRLEETADEDTVREVRAGLAERLAQALRDVLTSDGLARAIASSVKPFTEQVSGSSAGRFRGSDEPLAQAFEPWLTGTTYPVYLDAGPVRWLRLMPTVDPGRLWTVAELKRAQGADLPLSPFGSNSTAAIGLLRAEDGFGTRVMHGDGKSHTAWATFAFETGEIWGVDAYLMRAAGAGRNPSIVVAPELFSEALERFATHLRRLGVPGPLRWIAGIEGVRGLPLESGAGFRGSCIVDVVSQEGQYDGMVSGMEALRPFFELLYDRCGLEWSGAA